MLGTSYSEDEYTVGQDRTNGPDENETVIDYRLSAGGATTYCDVEEILRTEYGIRQVTLIEFWTEVLVTKWLRVSP